MAMYTKGLILFTAVLAIAYSYRMNDDGYYDSRVDERKEFYETRQDINDELVVKRGGHECKYSKGLCNNVYSYGCRDKVRKCDGSGCVDVVSNIFKAFWFQSSL